MSDAIAFTLVLPTLIGSTLNAAPGAPTKGLPPQTVTFTGEMVERETRSRFNPLRSLTPETLGITLDNFNAGLVRDASLLWERIAERDDTLVSVKPKRELAPTLADWQVLPVEDADEAEADRHAAALKWFYNNLTATNAFDRNQRGGIELLIQQMMQARSYKYAVHHLVWRPQPGRTIKAGGKTVPALTAEFEFVPLSFFENTTGRLRFVPDGGFGVAGQPLDWDSGEWICTASDHALMFAASICYTFKKLTFDDWVIFNERYAQGKVLGRTPAGKDSPEGEAMAEMVAAFNGDMAAVIYGAQGDKSPIEVIEPKGNSPEFFEKFVERQDRKLAAMFRGADLSTMSAGNGEGSGASLQGDEQNLLERADLRMLAGVLMRQIDKVVIRALFGEGVDPAAYFVFPVADEEDAQQVRENAGFMADRGFPVDADNIAERLSIVKAENTEPTLGKATPAPAAPGEPVKLPKKTGNAAPGPDGPVLGPLLATARDVLGAATEHDLKPLRTALAALLDGPPELLPARSVIFLTELPRLAREIAREPEAALVLAETMGAALATGLSETASAKS